MRKMTKQNSRGTPHPYGKNADHTGAANVDDDEEEEGLTLIASIRRKWKERHVDDGSSSSTFIGGMVKSRSNNSSQQTRAVMSKAMSYSLAFFLTYLFPITISIRTLAGIYSGQTLSVMARAFFPLQGFFNFVVFLHPKVVSAKNNTGQRRGEGGSISWFEAFVKVITAKEQQHHQGLDRYNSNNLWTSTTRRKRGRSITDVASSTISSFCHHSEIVLEV